MNHHEVHDEEKQVGVCERNDREGDGHDQL